MSNHNTRIPSNPPRPMRIAPARVAALEALMDVQISESYAGLALTRRIAESRLSALDRRLMTELFYGVLENKLHLDYLLSFYMDRPCQDDVTLQILRMGVYQLKKMDRIPANAICNDAVELAKKFKRQSMAPLVNAVLRAMVREPDRATQPEDETERLSVTYSFPKWLVVKLIEEYGREFAEDMMRYRSESHFVTIRPNLLRMNDAAAFEKSLDAQSISWEKGQVPQSYRVTGGYVAQSAGFRTGEFSVMGEGSMLAVQAMGVKNGQSVLDCCAAPGGKACYLAESLHGTGRVYAWDLHEHRVKLISSAAQRLGLDNLRVRVQDARELVEEQEGRMDAVLVDAPCSGLGDYLSKPDIKYNIKPEDMASLHELQGEILDTCCRYVKPGGTLVYSTCTLFKEENEQTVVAFLAKHPEFRLEGLEQRLPENFAKQTVDGCLTLFPHRDGMDGFFIARMVRARR